MTIKQDFIYDENEKKLYHVTEQDTTELYEGIKAIQPYIEENVMGNVRKDYGVYLARIPTELVYQYLNKYGKTFREFMQNEDVSEFIFKKIISENENLRLQGKIKS